MKLVRLLVVGFVCILLSVALLFTPTTASAAEAGLSFGGNLIASGIEHGLSAQTLVFLLLLPVVATLVAFSRHIVGLTGFSIFAPAGLAIVFLSTGVIPGITLFFLMLLVGVLGKWLISFLKLEYVPRTSMLLWFVSVGIFLSLLLSTTIPGFSGFKIDIFPILLLVLLAEDFMAPMAGVRWNLILERSLQIMFLAVIGELMMGSPEIQQFALRSPEVVILVVAVANFLIGRYLGLRLSEYFRFRPLLDAEE